MNTQAAVVDFGTSKVVTIIAKSKANKSERLEIIGTGSVLYDGFRDGDWNTPEKLVESVRNSISAAELQAHEKVHEIYVGVPGEYIKVYTASVETPISDPDGRVQQEDIDRLHDEAAAELELLEQDGIVLHRSPAWYMIGRQGAITLAPLEAEATGDVLLGEISFVLADRQFMNDIAELMGMLNITVVGYFSSSLGTALLMAPPEQRDNTCMMIDVGYLNTEINVIRGEAIVAHEMIDIGGSELVVALADELRMDLREAERVKRTFSFKPDRMEEEEDIEIRDPYSGRRRAIPRYDVNDVLLPAMDDITGEIVDVIYGKHLHELMTQTSKIYLTGGGIAMMRGARERLADAIGNYEVSNVTSKTAKLNYPMFSSALGLASMVFDTVMADAPVEEQGAFSKLAGLFRR